MSTVPEREEIPEQYTWDLESIFESDATWEEAFEDVKRRLEDLESMADRVTDDGPSLLATLELRDEIGREVDQVVAYARMRSHEDTRDQEYQALAARARALASEAQSAASFIEPAIQAEDRDRIEAMIDETDGLEHYRHELQDILRLKPHTRSAEVEELLADLGEVLGAPHDVYSMLTDADMTFPTVDHPDGTSVEITQSNFTRLLKHDDREFRRTVHEAFYDELETVRNTVGATLKNSVKADVKLARARDYETAREAALDGPNVPIEVYDTLCETVRDSLAPLHRHVELKRDALDVEELQMWDLYSPMTPTESPDIGYAEAVEHVVDSVAPLGEDYQTRVESGLAARWVDVYENRGKRSGAYSGGTYDTHPFILMNYQDDITSMYTLAHELGHSLHSELTAENQPYVYSDYDIFVAEVASTVNEQLLTHHLLETVDDPRFRRHVLDESLERFRSTLFRQTMFAAYESVIHRLEESGEALTPDVLDDRYRDLKTEFYAPASLDDRIEREWMRIPHFYYNFYVYQYATGMSAAVALAEGIIEDGPDATERYLTFIRSGSRKYPLELLEIAGVDMTDPEPIERAIAVYDDYVDEMAALVEAD